MKQKKIDACNRSGETEEGIILSPLHEAERIEGLFKNPDFDEKYQTLRAFLKSVKENNCLWQGHTLYVPKMNKLLYVILGASTLLTVVYLFILNLSLFILIGSEFYHNFSVKFLSISVAVLVINALLLAYSANEIRFGKHYEKYCSILQYRGVEAIELLAAYTEIQSAIVQRDLKMAVKKGILPEGYFQDHDKVFSVSRGKAEIAEEELCRLSPDELKNLHGEVGKSLAKYVGKSGISQMKDRMSETLQEETVKTLMLYCYEVHAHPENKDKTMVVLTSYLDAVDIILCGGHGTWSAYSQKYEDREEMLHLLNKLFYSLLCELCRQ